MPHFGEWDWSHITNILNSNGKEWAPLGANIQLAIDDLPAAGGKVWLPQGTLTLTTEILVTSNNVALIGCGDGTIIQLGADIHGIHGQGAGAYPNTLQRLVVKDLKIIGPGATHTNAGIYLEYSNWAYISNVHFEECYYGISTINGGDNFIVGTHHTMWYKWAIFISDDENTIMNNIVDVSQAALVGVADKMGIVLAHSNNVASGNVIEHIYGASADAIYVTRTNNIITGNHIREADRYGLTLTSTALRNVVVGNDISSNGNHGIACGGDDNPIHSNYIYDNGGFGINLEATSLDNSLKVNVFSGNTSGAVQDLGTTNKIDSNEGNVGIFQSGAAFAAPAGTPSAGTKCVFEETTGGTTRLYIYDSAGWHFINQSG